MKTATLEQGGKLIKMIVDKGTPTEQLQWAFDSGALSDVLDANPQGFDRNVFRKFLGLKPLNPGLLIPVGTAVAVTTTPFVARDRFVLNTKQDGRVRISFLGDNFKAWFLNKTEEAFAGSTLKYGKLSRNSVDGPIITELGGEDKAETSLTEVFALIEAQGDGVGGPLHTGGYANIFYVRDTTGVLRTVRVRWDDGAWGVHAGVVAHPYTWGAGYLVFSRNSC